MSPDLNPIEHLCGILKQKVAVHKVIYILQLHGYEGSYDMRNTYMSFWFLIDK